MERSNSIRPGSEESEISRPGLGRGQSIRPGQEESEAVHSGLGRGQPIRPGLDRSLSIRPGSAPSSQETGISQDTVSSTTPSSLVAPDQHIHCCGSTYICYTRASPRFDPELRPPGLRPEPERSYVAKEACRRSPFCHCCSEVSCPETVRCSRICFPRSRLSNYCDSCLRGCAWSPSLQDYKWFWTNCVRRR